VKNKISAPKRAIRKVINIKTVTFWRYQNLAIVSALICSLLSFVVTPANAIGSPYDPVAESGDVVP
jgi:hypothetical protein